MYPFGMTIKDRNWFDANGAYRYGFNGMRKENSFGNGSGSHLDFGARIYDSRIGRFRSIDPRWNEYESMSPYVYAANNPIFYTDDNGEGPLPCCFRFC